MLNLGGIRFSGSSGNSGCSTAGTAPGRPPPLLADRALARWCRCSRCMRSHGAWVLAFWRPKMNTLPGAAASSAKKPAAKALSTGGKLLREREEAMIERCQDAPVAGPTQGAQVPSAMLASTVGLTGVTRALRRRAGDRVAERMVRVWFTLRTSRSRVEGHRTGGSGTMAPTKKKPGRLQLAKRVPGWVVRHGASNRALPRAAAPRSASSCSG